jgi:transcriptional regulator with XRE-family HTH domain
MVSRGPFPVDLLVGQNIRICRLRKGWSQTELGRKIGLTFQQIQKYEKGANRVGASRLTQIAEVLGVPLTVLFDGAATATNSDQRSARAMLARPHSLRLLESFDRIGQERVKLAILNLVESIAIGKK